MVLIVQSTAIFLDTTNFDYVYHNLLRSESCMLVVEVYER